ncbi:hypothetical protein B0G81_6242 [Paraburkholderia sp. BL6665CI2N2]|uniref:hypothetical protein n=1 Tax=Paraburkholderia sp. BL6665CI2N2 TaxID=1938806 RepID=UPI0010655B29|nr:hypothetical protein [Paraburkholderia sp. BL6665CI2N2]TDY25759.1 hypothetical protein B0G81_6242 [Paraburkholderia sp. BL6665CI2N2]
MTNQNDPTGLEKLTHSIDDLNAVESIQQRSARHTHIARVGLPLQVPAAPGTIAYFDNDGVESVEPIIAFAVEMHERIRVDGYKDYVYQTMPIGIDGEIDSFTVIAMPDGAIHFSDGTVQSLEEYRAARKLAQKWK